VREIWRRGVEVDSTPNFTHIGAGVGMGMRVSCAKTAELIEMPFVGQVYVGPRNVVLDGGPDLPTGRSTFEGDIPCTRQTNAFTAMRDDKTLMQPFAKLLWCYFLVVVIVVGT